MSTTRTLTRTLLTTIIRRACLRVLPPEWRVLPDGRATHSVIATTALLSVPRRMYTPVVARVAAFQAWRDATGADPDDTTARALAAAADAVWAVGEPELPASFASRYPTVPGTR